MSDGQAKLVKVTTETGYVPQQSEPAQNKFVFFYTVTIKNDSEVPCQLLSRHWVIQDSNRKVEEVYGEGVVGEQPLIQPGEYYQYTSGAVLETEIGTMEGRYFMVCRSELNDQDKQEKDTQEKGIQEVDAQEFEITIPRFTLSVPRTLH